VGSASPTWNTDGGLATFSGNTYTYDAMQRVTEIDYTGGKTLFSYDPLGRRVKKVDENSSGTALSTFSYHYDGSSVAVEYQPSTTWTYFGGMMRTDGTNKQWYYRDGHGSVSAVADNSGNLLEAYEYNAQGQFQITNASSTVISTTAICNDLLYAGYRYDLETGNYFCNARYYNPALSQGTNLYTYCRNDCVDSTDPTGMWTPAPDGSPISAGQEREKSCAAAAVRAAIYKLTGKDVPEAEIRAAIAKSWNARAAAGATDSDGNPLKMNDNYNSQGGDVGDAKDILSKYGIGEGTGDIKGAASQFAKGDVVIAGTTMNDPDGKPQGHVVALLGNEDPEDDEWKGYDSFDGYNGYSTTNGAALTSGTSVLFLK
jgi:RHS repeat-associated protein